MNFAPNMDVPPVPAEPVRVRPRPATMPIGPLQCQFFAAGNVPDSIADQWTSLAQYAAEPNAFAERWFLEPSLIHLAQTRDVRIAVILSADGLLAGIMPLALKTDYGRIPLRNVQNWKHDNAFFGAPLIRRGMEQAFWDALLVGLDCEDWTKGLIHIAGLDPRGPVFAGLRRAAKQADRPCDIVYRVHRALLQTDKSPEEYWSDSVRQKKRKEINRLSHRLAETGDVRYSTLEPGGNLNVWIEEFLTLEAKGWKGEAGSAFACTPKLAAFLRETLTRAHIAGRLDFHRLDVDGKPIAMLINFLSPPGGFSFKIAFDEDFARYSPGTLIERYNLRILDNREIAWMDSCASQDHPMIDSLWRERREIVRVTLPLGGRWNRAVFHACRGPERAAMFLRQIRQRKGDRG